MSVIVSSALAVPDESSAVGVPVFSDQLDQAGADADVLRHLGFEGKVDQLCVLTEDGSIRVLLGLGEAAKVTRTTVRRAAAAFVRAVRKHEHVSTTLVNALPADPSGAAHAVAEGIVLGSYEYLAYKSKPNGTNLQTAVVIGPASIEAAVARGVTLAGCVTWARDLVNEPGGSLTPERLAEEAVALGAAAGFEVTVHDAAAIEELRFGGLLGVNRGSSNPPRFIEAVYRPEGASRGCVAIVGKGITFDSGGLSLKTGVGMMTMKCDMAGSAATLATLAAAARLKLPVEVRGYVPATDNMTGPDATRPGDVLTLRNGKTIEVLNTDAEGRLILADALAFASEAKPDAMVDLATLTGACMVALGPKIAGLMGNDDGWLAMLEAASASSGESIWRLPLPAEYRKQADSTVADMKNIGGPHGGALVAGLILQEFVGEGVPWAHLDIAGPAFTETDDVETGKGATGFGVRLLVDALESFGADA